MAIGDGTGSGKTRFVKMNKELGKFFIKVNEDDAGAVAHTIAMGANTGKIEHRLYFGFIEGEFTGFKTEESDYGYFYIFQIEDKEIGETYVLSLSAEDYNARLYCLKLALAKAGDKVKLGVFKGKNEAGDSRNVGWVHINGAKTGYAFDKEEVPAPDEIKNKGKKSTWNYTKVLEFFDEKVIPMLPQIGGSEEAAPSQGAKSESDLPF